MHIPSRSNLLFFMSNLMYVNEKLNAYVETKNGYCVLLPSRRYFYPVRLHIEY
jgi:hypothetical protein